MLVVTRYRFKGDQSPESVKALLAVFAEHGSWSTGRSPTTCSPTVAVASPSPRSIPFRTATQGALRYQQWMDMETRPILTIEDAMPAIGTVFG